MAQPTFKVLSLFSGAMGLDIGLERTGLFETVACVEVEPIFCETIRLNRDAARLSNPHLLIINEDIRTINPLMLLQTLKLKPGEIDLIAGGPPCQAFSLYGKRRGIQDARGQLVFEFIRFVEAIRPRAFLMENVRGLLSMKSNGTSEKGSLFQEIQERFSEIGYRTDCFVVNAVNYGAPQIRERLMVVGNRFNVDADFPPPTHSNRPADRLQPFATLGDVLQEPNELDKTIMDFSPRKKHYLSMVPPGGNWRSLPIEIQQESMGKVFYLKGGRSAYWRKLSYDFPCPTIVTMPNHAGTSLCHPEELRPLCVGECALVQGFPSNWEFCGTPAEKYQQIGNAVPVRLGEVAGQAIAELLSSVQSLATSTYKPALRDRIVHIRPHVRTRSWWKYGQVLSGISYYKRPNSSHEIGHQLPLL